MCSAVERAVERAVEMTGERPVAKKTAWWSAETIDWYIRAAKFSDFHEKLGRIIARQINPYQSVLEVGCGLGYITKELSCKGYQIEGIDIDKSVIQKGRKLHGLNKRLSVDDYKITDKRADVVLAVFCGKVDEEGLGYFERLATKKIVYIISKHKFNSLRTDKTEEICAYLDKLDYCYQLEEFSLRFDQPFISQAEADQFFTLQYGNAGQQLKATSGLLGTYYPLVYENQKEMSLFVIDLTKRHL